MQATKKPTVIYAESTPNPNTMKFVANYFLVDAAVSVEYNSKAEASGAPLASRLFDFPFVKAVFITGNFIAIAKNDSISWDYVILELREFIKEYLSEGKPVLTEMPSASAIEEKTESESGQMFHAEATSETDVKIINILEEYVRPAVEQDGGAIYFHSYKDGVVTVTLRGACSGCPSSTMTLKAGIEGLLQRMVPEVKEVVAAD